MVKNLPASVRDMGPIPDPGRSYMPQSSPCARATESVLQILGAATAEAICFNYGSTQALEPVIHNKRGHCSETSVHCN